MKERSMSLVSHLREASTVSKRRGTPPKKTTTKSKVQTEVNRTKKRPAEDEESKERLSKVSRTESKANTSKKMSTGSSALTKASIPEIIDLLSDSEAEEEPTETKDDKKKREQPANMLRHLNTWQSHRATVQPKPPTTVAHSSWEFPKADTPDNISDLTPGPTHTIQTTENGTEELQRLLRDLQAAYDKARLLQQEMEKKEASSMLEKQKSETKHQQDIAKLTNDLEAEKNQSLRLAEEMSIKYTQLENDYRAVWAQYDQEKRDRIQEQQSHAEVLNDILKPKAEEKGTSDDMEASKKEIARLSAENVALKAKAASSQSRSTLSPVPSSTGSTDEDRREDNVRKIYIKTKRQYDVLLAVANNLITCTRAMDLTCFGEFGNYMVKLRKAIEGDNSTLNRLAPVVAKQDDDDE
jgi:hypothetical protein